MRLKANRYWLIAAMAVFSVIIGYFGIGMWLSVGAVVLPIAPPSNPGAAVAEPGAGLAATDADVPAGRADQSAEPAAVASPYELPAIEEGEGNPVYIQIPSIGVDAPVERVTLTSDGSMDVPGDPGNAGWYALGPRPGEAGSAAIAGHVAWFDGETAVFSSLHKVAPGDAILVRNDDGSDAAFVVREIRTYAADADATDIFVSRDGKAHLNLITCVGEWDRDAGQYAERLVVFADQETR